MEYCEGSGSYSCGKEDDLMIGTEEHNVIVVTRNNCVKTVFDLGNSIPSFQLVHLLT
jgi:hypothetical protein